MRIIKVICFCFALTLFMTSCGMNTSIREDDANQSYEESMAELELRRAQIKAELEFKRAQLEALSD